MVSKINTNNNISYDTTTNNYVKVKLDSNKIKSFLFNIKPNETEITYFTLDGFQRQTGKEQKQNITQNKNIFVKDEKQVVEDRKEQQEAYSDENPTKLFERVLNFGGKSWEEEDVKKDEQFVELTQEEQKTLKDRVEKYEQYRASLSKEDRKKLDDYKQNMRYFDKTDGYKKIYDSKDYSKMQKTQLLDILHYTDTTDATQDGKIGSFRQGHTGSCWFLSTLRNASEDKENSQTIKDSIKDNGDGTYIVKFKGAEEFIRQRADIDFKKYNKGFYGQKLVDDIKDVSEDERCQLKTFWDKIANGEDVKPKNDNEKLLLEKYKEYQREYAPEKLQQKKEQYVQDRIKELKDGVIVTEKELKENKRILQNGKVVEDAYSSGDKDVTILEMAADKFIRKASNGESDIDGNTIKAGNLLLLGKTSKEYTCDKEVSKTEYDALQARRDAGEITETEMWELQSYRQLSDKEKQEWIQILENTEPSRLAAGTKNPSGEEIERYNTTPDNIRVPLKSDRLGERRICKNHLYNISRVDKEKKIIYVENPWEPDVQIPMEYEEFFRYFRDFTVVDK